MANDPFLVSQIALAAGIITGTVIGVTVLRLRALFHK